MNAKELDEAYASGTFVDADIADVAVAARESLGDRREVGGVSRDVAFSGLMNQWVDANWSRTLDAIRGYAKECEREYHGVAKRGIMRVTGATEAEYARAVEDSRHGDPSPLLKMRTAYLDTI